MYKYFKYRFFDNIIKIRSLVTPTKKSQIDFSIYNKKKLFL